jgi:tetratricopeptide (TPR) repeat protein
MRARIAQYRRGIFPGLMIKRILALLISLAVAATVCAVAGRLFLASYFNASSDSEHWLKAARLVPGNAEYWMHLARYRQWDFDGSDFRLARQYYEKAVATDPRSSRDWMELAGAYEQAGDNGAARHAFDQAVSLYPLSAEVKWNYGNFLLRQGDTAEGFTQLGRAASIEPDLTPLALSRCWESDPDVGLILSEVVPHTVDSYADAMDFFATVHDVNAGLQAWNRLLVLKQPFQLKVTFDLITEMVHQQRATEAQQLWRQAYDALGLRYDKPADGSVVWNGGFEHDVASGGMDWNLNGATGVTIQPVTSNVHSGKRSLLVTFGGSSNIDFTHVFEYVPVVPSCTYHFRAFMRTEVITTDSGMRFYVADPYSNGAVRLITPNTVGTHDWTAVEADITTGPDSHVVLVQLRRIPSRLFENKIEGAVWIDDVSLTPATECPAPKS